MTSSHAAQWGLDPKVVFLNHGSFGAWPRPVLRYQQRLQEQMESQPLLFLDREIDPFLDKARREVASFVGAHADDLAFLPDASTGINTILGSLRLVTGDEILFTSPETSSAEKRP
ncbi:MAG: hypothetical protein WA705_19225 [Candidatus Ozemobacteraceae bacterium]